MLSDAQDMINEEIMMHLDEFDFDLPQGLIAQDPLEDRAGSRLLVLDKETGEVEHRMFRDILSFLQDVYKRQDLLFGAYVS